MRTAISLFAVAMMAMPALAQQRPAPSVSAYSARTVPWPGEKQPMVPGVPLPAESPRTMYYKKEAGPPVYERAAGLMKPVGADEPLPPAREINEKGTEFTQWPPAGMFRPDADTGKLLMFALEDEKKILRRVIDNPQMQKERRLVDEPQKTDFSGRQFAPSTLLIEPNYVCYGRLLFEEKNSERYGWTYGPIQPIISTADFFNKVSLLPYLIFSYPCHRYDCGAGHCLPGDPVPYLLYPPSVSLTGAAAQASVAVALSFIFP